VSSLEGLSQGLCVIAGLDKWNIRCIEEIAETNELPWVVMNRENLTRQFEFLIDHSSYFLEKAEQARFFMKSYWHPKKIVEHLMDFFSAAL
jgi:2-oxo-4-hydroxy-4-carboxy--5-ureidoimidazoline (OHCU) decarboxylase